MAGLTTQWAWSGQADATERVRKRKSMPEHGPGRDRTAWGFSRRHIIDCGVCLGRKDSAEAKVFLAVNSILRLTITNKRIPGKEWAKKSFQKLDFLENLPKFGYGYQTLNSGCYVISAGCGKCTATIPNPLAASSILARGTTPLLDLFLLLLPDADLLFRCLGLRLNVGGGGTDADPPFGCRGRPGAAKLAFDVFTADALLHDGILLERGLSHGLPPFSNRQKFDIGSKMMQPAAPPFPSARDG